MLRTASRPVRSGRPTATWRSKAAGPQQRRIEHVGPVGRRHDDDFLIGLEPVHFDEHLVQRLLALVVRTAQAREALPSDGVQFVDKDDRRRVLLCLVEEVAHAAGADADEHLDELRGGDAEERHARFAGHRSRHQRLAGARRADQQHAARQARAELVVFGGVAQEVDDLGQLLLGFFLARPRPRTSPVAVPGHVAAPWSGQSQRRSAAAGHLPAHEDDQSDDEQERQEADQQAGPNRA